MDTIRTCLWFNKIALDAVEFYVEIFPNSKIWKISYYDDSNHYWEVWEIMTVEFYINNSPFLALNWWDEFKFTPATSFIIYCENDDEINYFYEKLSYIKEAEQCGWILDKFWISWQIVPKWLEKYIKNKKVMTEMLKMKRLSFSALENIYNS